MAEFTGNVHNLELALPFPAPPAGGDPDYSIGRTFGDATSSDGMDVWVNGTDTTTYDPPDGAPVTLPLRTLIACTHGWLRLVAAGSAVPGVRTRTGAPLVVTDDTLVLRVWPTLRTSLGRMAESGSFLVPQTEEGRGGRPALDVLLYENVSRPSLQTHVPAIIAEERPDPFFDAGDRDAMLQSFLQGDIQVLARAGRVIGSAGAGDPGPLAPPPPADDTWARVTFRAVDRLGQLFDPGYFLRRVQELSQVFEPPVIIDKTLIPSREAVGGHPLPKLTPSRRIVDWRDEIGRPVAGARFSWPPATGGPAELVPTDGSGLWIGPTLAAGADPLAVTRMVLVPEGEGVRVGTLPDAPRSYPALDRDAMADDYLVVSAIDLHDWFPARPPPATPSEEPLRRFTEGNRVTALVDARALYTYQYRALRRTFRADDFTGVPEGGRAPDGPPLGPAQVLGNRIYIAGWKLALELWLPDWDPEYVAVDYDAQGVPVAGQAFNARGHVMGILGEAIADGVDVRALLWPQLQETPDFKTNNSAAAAAINRTEGGRRGQAILDAVSRLLGSHHTKALVVQNADGRLAFIGGIDLARGRWDTPDHLPGDERAQGGRDPANDGWHDVHCMVEGPAVDDVETNFRQRWNANPDAATGGRTQVPSREPAEQIDPIPQASHHVQINRTLPPGLPLDDFVNVQHGDPGARAARLNAIRRARRYVYLEEQYLMMVSMADYADLLASPNPLSFVPADPDTIAAALRERLVGPDPVEFVAILVPRKVDEDPAFSNGVIYELRKRFVTFLTHGLTDDQVRDRLLVFHLRNRSGQPTYVHAKTMIVDDVWASIGSSNVGYRSMTYDGEINCDVVDGALALGRRRYARDLRISLWAEHLRLGTRGAPMLLDHRHGFELLRAAAEGNLARPHHLMPYDPNFFGEGTLPNPPPPYDPANTDHEIVRTRLVDPDGRVDDDPLLDYEALIALVRSL
jgi:phosphatidylserine/phosphatidylglycerophosphate/cardiolipin synthase-like enzyme